MAGRYWDVRTCRWQGGGVEEQPLVWTSAQQQPVQLRDAVPAQPTTEQAEAPDVVAGTA
jgi:hypothetical protein